LIAGGVFAPNPARPSPPKPLLQHWVKFAQECDLICRLEKPLMVDINPATSSSSRAAGMDRRLAIFVLVRDTEMRPAGIREKIADVRQEEKRKRVAALHCGWLRAYLENKKMKNSMKNEKYIYAGKYHQSRIGHFQSVGLAHSLSSLLCSKEESLIRLSNQEIRSLSAPCHVSIRPAAQISIPPELNVNVRTISNHIRFQ
jgi:hypothetical protein